MDPVYIRRVEMNLLEERKFLETDPDYLFLNIYSPKKGLSGSCTSLFRICTVPPSSTKHKDRLSLIKFCISQEMKNLENEVSVKEDLPQIL